MVMKAKRVLIVEDDLILSLLESKMLTKLGYDVSGTVTTGEKAVQTAVELQPDFIVMDINLEGDIDGLQAARLIRKSSDVPIIFVSGNSDWYQKERHSLQGSSAFVSKPFTPNELNESFKKVAEYEKVHC